MMAIRCDFYVRVARTKMSTGLKLNDEKYTDR